MPYMYILECADGSYYTGSTWDMEKRLWEHQNGQGANHTAKHLPVKLVYVEEGDRIEDAFRREKQIQGWSRKKKQALIAGDTNVLHRLAECRNDSHWSRFGFTSTGSVHRGSAHPTGGFAQPTGLVPSAKADPSGLRDSSCSPRDFSGRSLSDFSGRSLSEVEGNNANDSIND
ncbi:MAG: GIY-YIG nuclease family protein [Sulfuricella denitrificans]|nr:GIY-YIG nuclease family protein [Sulfuricella denitrificans]